MKLSNALVFLVLGVCAAVRRIAFRVRAKYYAYLGGRAASAVGYRDSQRRRIPRSQEVDGKEGSYTGQVSRVGGFELHFLPGRHAIDVEYNQAYTRSVLPTTLYFVAEKDKTYQVKYEILHDARNGALGLKKVRAYEPERFRRATRQAQRDASHASRGELT